MCCFQCGKVNKFESDSQLFDEDPFPAMRCFQCGKVNKFESDSQQFLRELCYLIRCFQCGKVNKFESDSQHGSDDLLLVKCCFQCGKVNKFESDSQPLSVLYSVAVCCFQCVKVTNLRAIHKKTNIFILTFCFSKILRIFAQTERSGTLRSVRCGGATAPYRFFVGNTFLTLDSNKMGKNARSIV